jgi:integrase
MPTQKPEKPYPEFPLFYHKTGQWAKKVRGRMIYFGVDHDKALAKWLADRDYLLAGTTPPLHRDGITVRELANRFLNAKKRLVETGELSARTWRDYYLTCERLVDRLGKGRAVDTLNGPDFEQLRATIAKTFGPVALGNEIQRVRTVMKFAWDEQLIDKPVRFGASFKKPSLKTMRKARHAAGPKMLEAAAVRKIIDAAGVPMKAMALLAVNCGLGNLDVANLTLASLDLEGGWLNYPREKTGIGRRCPLWPETVTAIREAIEERPEPKNDADSELVFLTRSRNRWVRVKPRKDEKGNDKPGLPIDSIQKEWRKLLEGVNVRHVSFYRLRHIHRTVADGAKDQPAADHIMGHVDPSMSAVYRERVDDARLKSVVQIVHDWLFEEE